MLTIINSTISGNSGNFAAGIDAFGTVNFNNVTITENRATGGDGGGIYNHTGIVINLSNTILAGNTASGTGPECFTEPGSELTSFG
jgi:hypothetical protein